MTRELVLTTEGAPDSGPVDRYAGVRALWIKVIIRAVYDWVTYRDSLRLPQKKLADSAATWLFEESELFNSFTNVCMYVGLDPEEVRHRIKSMSKEDVAKIEYLERVGSEGSSSSGMLSEAKLLGASSGGDDEVF